jgi:uncharacterized protein YbcI
MLHEDDPDTADHDGVKQATPALEISNAISRLHKEYVGRGPANARTTIDGELVVVVLEGGFTRAERTLDDSDQHVLVVAGRIGLQDAMRDAMVQAVEEVLGRRVRSFMSAHDMERNLQADVFVLEGPDVPAANDQPSAAT